MKLISLAEFFAMPEGTVYQEVDVHNNVGPISVKADTMGDEDGPSDFGYAELQMDILHGEAGFQGIGRWGLYDDNSKFLVWDEDDRKTLSRWLLAPTDALNEINDSKRISV